MLWYKVQASVQCHFLTVTIYLYVQAVQTRDKAQVQHSKEYLETHQAGSKEERENSKHIKRTCKKAGEVISPIQMDCLPR